MAQIFGFALVSFTGLLLLAFMLIIAILLITALCVIGWNASYTCCAHAPTKAEEDSRPAGTLNSANLLLQRSMREV